MSGAQIAAEVAAALAEAGAATGNGPLVGFMSAPEMGGNPWDGPDISPIPVAVTVILDEWTSAEMKDLQILTSDKKVLVDATGPAPVTGGTLTINGKAHRIERVMPLAPGGEALMYTVHAREAGGWDE